MAILSELFKPMPPNRRQELNKLVEKLLEVTSNLVNGIKLINEKRKTK